MATTDIQSDFFAIPLRRADGGETTLAEFRGKVLLLVNVASKCGLTPQYEGLERIQEKHAARGFTVLGFPANEFAGQEPGSDEQIQEFCRLSYGVTFPVFAKLIVKGPGQHPLYALLTRAYPVATRKGSPVRQLLRKVLHGDSFTGEPGELTWNFEKFLIGRDGAIAGRFAPQVVPEDRLLIEAIEEELSKPA